MPSLIIYKMKKTFLGTLLLVGNILSAQNVEPKPKKFNKFCFSVNLLNTPSWIIGISSNRSKDVRFDLNSRYYLLENLFLNLNLGYATKNKYKYDILRQQGGPYAKLGVGGELCLSEQKEVNLFLAYNFCVSSNHRKFSGTINNYFWGDENTKLTFTDEKFSNTFSELYGGTRILLSDSHKINFYLEPALKFKFGLSNINQFSDDVFIAGFGKTNTNNKTQTYLTLVLGLGITF